jgi:hypothetical protein
LFAGAAVDGADGAALGVLAWLLELLPWTLGVLAIVGA